MRIGILATGYNCADGLEERLKPFMREDFVISAVSVPFEGFPTIHKENEETNRTFAKLQRDNKIKWFYCSNQTHSELEARNNALIPLLRTENCDYIWLVDVSDEYYTDKEIDYIVRFVNKRSEAWYSIHFKNYVFSPETWIDGFCPPRVFKTSYFTGRTLKMVDFCEDNGVNYKTPMGEIVNFRQLPSTAIPSYLAHIKHLTWLSNENSKRKYEYQMRRWNLCSYQWNYELNKLEFNKQYFLDKNLPIPEINYD